MRITNSILYRQSLTGLRDNLEAMERAQRQVTSGLRVERPSDDPVDASSVMRASSDLRALDQYTRNLSAGLSRLGAEEGVLEQITGVLERARELAVGQAGGTANAETREITAQEVRTLQDHLRDLGNTAFAGGYLFGGDFPDRQPFPPAGPDPAFPPQGELAVEIGAGTTAPTNHDGTSVFVDTGVLDAVEELAVALEADDPDGIRTALGSLDTAFDGIQELTAEVGARSRRLEVAVSNLEALDVNLRTLRSDLQDADMESAVTELVNRQTGYQAALLANARILQTTLTDYLR